MRQSGLTVTLCLLIVLFACKEESNPQAAQQAAQAMPLPVVQVETRDITTATDYPTIIEGINNNEVRAKIAGYVTKVYIDEGDYVNKGQALFHLETNTLNTQANAAQSGIDAASSTVEAAKANVEAAQIEVDKLVPLVEKDIISQVPLETARAQLLSAQSQLKQAEASYSQAQANLNTVHANINYATVRSPIRGVVGSLPLREGSLVGPTDMTPLTVISDISQLYAYFSMNEVQYLDFLEQTEGKNLKEKLEHFPEVTLIMANGKPYSEKGKIEAVTGQIDRQTGTVQFRASFPNQDGLLTNGNSGTIKIPLLLPDVLVIPEASTFEQQGYTYVYKVEDNKAIATVIKISARADNMAVVESGLTLDDQIVATGLSKLRNGTPITPQPIALDSVVQSIKPVF